MRVIIVSRATVRNRQTCASLSAILERLRSRGFLPDRVSPGESAFIHIRDSSPRTLLRVFSLINVKGRGGRFAECAGTIFKRDRGKLRVRNADVTVHLP